MKAEEEKYLWRKVFYFPSRSAFLPSHMRATEIDIIRNRGMMPVPTHTHTHTHIFSLNLWKIVEIWGHPRTIALCVSWREKSQTNLAFRRWRALKKWPESREIFLQHWILYTRAFRFGEKGGAQACKDVIFRSKMGYSEPIKRCQDWWQIGTWLEMSSPDEIKFLRSETDAGDAA